MNILPVDNEVFYSAPLFECMFDETESMMTEEELLLCKDGTYASADSVKIARGSDFADVLSEELLTELLDEIIIGFRHSSQKRIRLIKHCMSS